MKKRNDNDEGIQHQARAHTGVLKPSGKKLPVLFPLRRQPPVQSLTFLQGASSKPAVVFWAVAEPSDKVLPSTSALTRIDDALNVVFFKSIAGKDWLWLGEFSAREEHGIVRDMRLELGCMKRGGKRQVSSVVRGYNSRSLGVRE